LNNRGSFWIFSLCFFKICACLKTTPQSRLLVLSTDIASLTFLCNHVALLMPSTTLSNSHTNPCSLPCLHYHYYYATDHCCHRTHFCCFSPIAFALHV
jgi:hypothetical protein